MIPFLVRTGQEEMRTQNKNQLLALQNNTTDDSNIKPKDHFDDEIDHHIPKYSFTLSTEMCMTIHGVILASLFVVAITR